MKTIWTLIILLVVILVGYVGWQVGVPVPQTIRRGADDTKQSISEPPRPQAVDDVLEPTHPHPDPSPRRIIGMGHITEKDRHAYAVKTMQEPLGMGTPVVLDNNQLNHILELLRNLTGLNFAVFWDVLNEIGIHEDTRISLDITHMTRDQALTMVLDQASRDKDGRAAYAIIDGIVTISTEADLKNVASNGP